MIENENFNREIEIKLSKYNEHNVFLTLCNNDYNFTQKIIKDNIVIQNLRYKVILENIDKMETVIKSKYIPKFSKTENQRVTYFEYSFYDVEVILTDLKSEYLYKISVELVELFPNYLPEIPHKSSQKTNILVCTRHGLINEDKIDKLNKNRYGKKFTSLSEKEAMKQINAEMEFRELTDILNKKDVKKMTYHNRDFNGINKFLNNNDKFSKKMTEERKKKVLYTTNAKLFFEEKMEKNNAENKFMNNEWFMGPIYSYDQNYKKLI